MSNDDDGGDENPSAGEEDDEDEDMEADDVASVNSVAGDDSDDVNDFEFVRSIRKELSSPYDGQPLSTLPPADEEEEEDDFETLRRIQQQFRAYETERSVAGRMAENQVGTGNDVGVPSPDATPSTLPRTLSTRIQAAMEAFVEEMKGSITKTLNTRLEVVEASLEEMKLTMVEMQQTMDGISRHLEKMITTQPRTQEDATNSQRPQEDRGSPNPTKKKKRFEKES